MKAIKIICEDRTKTFNPMFVKCVELVHDKVSGNWCVNVIHVINDREVVEPVVCKDKLSALELNKEYTSCLESI